jgi:endoglucanase
MATTSKKRLFGSAALSAVALVAALAIPAAPAFAANDVLLPGKTMYVDPGSTTIAAASTLTGQARADAQLLGSFPSASWFTKGTPAEVKSSVAKVVGAATTASAVPVLVAYNLPFRDCGQYSSGGAASIAAYGAWIDGFAAGIGTRSAAVILEPDGLGIIPWYTTVNGSEDSCRPAEADPATAASDRFAALNHAVDVLSALPNVAVYLDGTHSGWLGAGDSADRLIKAGVAKADGFFLNASNYVQSDRLQKYGTWVSDCIYLSLNSWYQPQWCGSQYYPASPTDFGTWGLTDAAYAKAFADTGLTPDASKQAHFVIDSSRNGQGPWTPPVGEYSDAEDWCNPPARGLGVTPTTTTGDPLIDAYLWIKVPGESDGQCFRGTAGPADPERGVIDPAAGGWFPAQARELIAYASPAVAAQTCDVSYTVHGSWPGGFNAQLVLKNTGTTAVNGWQLSWAFGGNQSIGNIWSASSSQKGAVVTATNLASNATIRPGKSLTFGFIGTTDAGVNPEPGLFVLNGKPCTSH